MHDINNDKAPANMLNLFQKTCNIHSYNTRSSTSGKFHVKSSRLKKTKQFFVSARSKAVEYDNKFFNGSSKESFKKSYPQIAIWYLRKRG